MRNEEVPDLDEDEIDGLIKVALLDTGVDMEHPKLKAYKKYGQLDKGLDLVDHENQHGMGDLDGHGTHMCHTLLRTAPFTRVYPIRVFEDRRSLEQDDEGRSASLVAEVWMVPWILTRSDIRMNVADLSRLLSTRSRHGE